MKKRKVTGLDFEIDKLTNSIENVLTGEVFDTEIVGLTSADSKQIKKADWQFNWNKELKDETKEVYKLTTVNNPTIIQGLLSIEDKQDHIFMHLIESSTKEKARFIWVFREIWSPTLVKYQLTKAMKASLLLTQRQRLSNIMSNRFMQPIFGD